MERHIHIIGSQMDLGASLKGVDMGPLAIRHAGLLAKLKKSGFTVTDLGDVVPDVAVEPGDPKLRYAKEINGANRRLYEKVSDAFKAGAFPLVIGGDHSIAAGSVPAAAERYGSVGVLWIDAHGDFNDENSTITGNMHGMPLSAVCGCGPDCMVDFSTGRVDPKKVVIIGARDMDPEEIVRLRDHGVTVFSISNVHTLGMPDVMRFAMETASAGTDAIHLSFDMDALEPSQAPGVGTPVTNGLTLREAFIVTEIVHRSGKLASMDLVETNPLLDIQNRTGILATDLILSALGSTDY